MHEAAHETSADPHRHIVALSGDLDLTNSEHIWDRLRPLLAPGHSLTLDLAALQFSDSTGLRVLLLARREAEAHGATLHLANPPAWLDALMDLGGIRHLFHTHLADNSTPALAA